MTCAECQDLLLDAAYGELDAARAAEVEAHARGCAACAGALAEIVGTRALVAPLSEPEEPPASLDEAVLQAAGAEAMLLGDGLQGPVIAADVRVQPLAVEAAQIDARARVKVPPGEGGRRRIALRAALAGSLAAAASLAVVVSLRTEKRPVPRGDGSGYRIQVRTADEARRAASYEAAERSRETATPQPATAAPSPKSPPADGAPARGPSAGNAGPPEPARRAAARARSEESGSSGSPPTAAQAGPAATPLASAESPPAPPGSAAAKGAPGRVAAKTEPAPAPARTAQAAPAAKTAQEAPAAKPAQDPAALERRAEASRRQGAFSAAAALYRQAFQARAASGDGSAAGWDLAHAVECLAAAGRFAEARAGRSELRTLYPAAQGPAAAADRALRAAPSDESPAAVPAAR